MPTLRRTVGAMVRHYREHAKLTQAELGDRVGKSMETIGRIERGTTAPSLQLLEKLADALSVEPRDLLGAGSYPARTRKVDPLAQLVDRLAGMSDEDIQRAEQLIDVAMSWKASR